jgi:hypothetical protein
MPSTAAQSNADAMVEEGAREQPPLPSPRSRSRAEREKASAARRDARAGAAAAPVPAAAEPDGERVEVLWGGTWYRAIALKREGPKTYIKYEGWSDSFNEWVTKDRIRARK